MTAPAPTTTAPTTFTLHGETTPALIAALARLLIAHARREVEAETAAAADGGADQHGGNRE